MKRNMLFIAFVSILLAHSPALALQRFDIVTTKQMKQMLDDRTAGKVDFLLVNALDEVIYRNSSIPGSINVPWSRVSAVTDRLGTDKNKLIITY